MASTTFAANRGCSDSGTASVTRPAPARPARAADQQRGAGVVERAGDDEELAERALVARAGRAGSRRAATSIVEPGPRRRDGCDGRLGGLVEAGEPERPPVAHRVTHRCRPRRRRGGFAQPLHAGEDPPLPVVEPLLDVGREDERPPVGPDAERDGHGVVVLVADRDGDPGHAQLLRPAGRAVVELDRRLAGGQPLDLDLPPADAPNPEAEDLADRLLGGPASGEGLRPVADVARSAVGQDPLRESRPEPGQGVADPGDLDDVDAELGDAGSDGAGRWRLRRRPASGNDPTRP